MDNELARHMIRLLESIDTKLTPRPSTRMKAKVEPETDTEWLHKLSENPVYAGIDVKLQYGKAQVWHDTHKRQLTRRSFVNWLNRADKPVVVTGPARHVNAPPVYTKPTPSLPKGEEPDERSRAALSRLLGKDMSF